MATLRVEVTDEELAELTVEVKSVWSTGSPAHVILHTLSGKLAAKLTKGVALKNGTWLFTFHPAGWLDLHPNLCPLTQDRFMAWAVVPR